jgi:predicted transcriptional regulator
LSQAHQLVYSSGRLPLRSASGAFGNRRAGWRADGDSAAATTRRSSPALRRLQHDHRARDLARRGLAATSPAWRGVQHSRDLREDRLDEIRSASYTRSFDMPTPPPTDAELNVLKVLWRSGPSTVRKVHEELYRNTEVGYTTTLKLLQNMFAKGLVKRNDEQRQHVYAPAVSERRTLDRLVRRWVDNTFAGSTTALAMRALDLKRVTRQELSSLKALIARLEERERGRG